MGIPYVYKNDEECNNNTLSQDLLLNFQKKIIFLHI